MWVDDPHLQPRVPRAPHGAAGARRLQEQLRQLTARIFSQQLDRSGNPLWELWLIEGLEGEPLRPHLQEPPLPDRRHPSGVDLATVLFDIAPVPAPVHRTPRATLATPSRAGHDRVGDRRRAGRPARRYRDRRGCADRGGRPSGPRAGPISARGGGGRGRGRLGGAQPPRRPPPLNVEIGPHRRFVGSVPCQLDEFKAVKNAFGGTVNDVVLSVVTGALRLVPDLPRRAYGRAGAARARARLPHAPRPTSSTTSAIVVSSPRAHHCRCTSPTRCNVCASSSGRWTA